MEKGKKAAVEVKGFFPFSQNPLGAGGFPFGPGFGVPQTGPAAGGGFMSFFNRIGGIDGMISMMGKMQKMMNMMKQFGPLLQMFNSFPAPQAATRSFETHRFDRKLVPSRSQTRVIRKSRKRKR